MFVKFETITYDEDLHEYTNGVLTDSGEVFDLEDKDLPAFTLPLDKEIEIYLKGGESVSGTLNEVLIKLDRANVFFPTR